MNQDAYLDDAIMSWTTLSSKKKFDPLSALEQIVIHIELDILEPHVILSLAKLHFKMAL